MRRIGFIVAVVLVPVLAAGGLLYRRAVPAANPAEAAADYRDPAHWVCRPGRHDSCATDLDATAIAADGALAPVHATRAANPGVDCFYVYPTVSRDRTQNAAMALSPEVDFVARDQFARFSTVCRPFAPLYRQTTLKALMAASLGLGSGGDAERAYADVRDAWQDYLAHENQGRGVVLIGHSQGSRRLKRLIQEEIEGKPAQKLLVAALLLGNNVVVPEGQDVGGDFKSVKLCRAPTQTGCVVAYSSFRASAPPPARARYGRDPAPGMQLACTNPAALAGGTAVLDGYYPVTIGRRGVPWTNPPAPIETPWVTVPGLVSATCVHEGGATYLAVRSNGAPGDRRLGDIGGDVVMLGKVLPGWGLHLIDMNLAQGDLVRLVQGQAQAFLAHK